MRIFLLSLVIAGCGTSSSTTDDGPSRKSVYLESLCRMYVEPACVTSQNDTCGGGFSFDTIEDCRQLFNFALLECDGITDAMEDNADVEACITELDAFTCTDPICDADQNFLPGGAPCAAVQTMIDERCPTDSGL